MTSKKEIINDLKFCKELMDRMIAFTESTYCDEHSYSSNHTAIQADIIRLRRELMSISHKLDWNYNDK